MSDLSCPKCGFERDPEAVECPVCGILYARYRGGAPPPPKELVEPSSFGAFDSELGSDGAQMYSSQIYEPVSGATPEATFSGSDGPGVFEPQMFDGAPLAMPGLRESNPYAAPRALVVDNSPMLDTGEMARRGTRLAARLLDIFVLFSTVMVTVVPLVMLAESTSLGPEVAMGIGALGMLALLGYNLYLLDRAGQTIGKKALKIRIVRANGDRVSLGRLLGLRWLVPTILGGVPLVGPVFGLANVLFIFREDQRCLHDHLADTKVVLA
ncbi:MAG: RDD family protein [Thermoanaerobaculia bacterium]|nr:RDD family protein [Thermoanaerobaculia bacterium]